MINLTNLCKNYPAKPKPVQALDNISLEVHKGEFIVIQGPSGSGKTTFLLTLGGMLQPTSGTVVVNNQDIYALNSSRRAKFRAQSIGFVFQMFHLLPYLNSVENVLLATGLDSNPMRKSEAVEFLEQMGLEDRTQHRPAQLSVGERQRTAVARALINNPDIILADEPTGNLDPDNTAQVMNYLNQFHQNDGTVIMATHGSDADSFADRIIYLLRGKLVNKI